MAEELKSDEMTRDEKIKSLDNWCIGHKCDPIYCRIYDLCHQYTGAWDEQSDVDIDKIYEAICEDNVDIDKIYEALWEGNADIHNLSKEHIVNPQCEVNMFDGDKINTAWKTLSPNDIRKMASYECPKKKVVVIINGRGGVGKDTCVSAVERRYVVVNCSSITPIKNAADMLGWNTCDKSDKARKFLSDLKLLSSEFNDYPFTHMMKEYEEFKQSPMLVMFVHIREPKEISKFKERVPECKTLLIKSRRVERGFGNPADDNVDNYDYDYVYHNDKSLDEVTMDFLCFFEKHVMEGE